MKWPCDFNRPLSPEERGVAARLKRLTQEQKEEIWSSDYSFAQTSRRDFDRDLMGKSDISES